MKSSLFALLLIVWLVADLPGDELTIGEREFIKAVGRDCPVVRLWPNSTGPDEPRPIGEEEFRTTDPVRQRAGLMNIVNVTHPSLIVVAPPKERSLGVAMLLCPGGGYGSLGTETVVETAQWMNERGITVVLLKYRVPKRHSGFAMNYHPLQDAQRAMGILRTRAAEWNLDPNKIGVGGFSAGGHLAASLSINHAKRWYKPVDKFDEASCRPDFAALLYPAYLTDPLLSRTRDPKLNYDLINAKDTPPTLISVTRPDKFTIGSVEYLLALMEAKVPAELHVYPAGGHGGSIEKYPFGQWAFEFVRFLGDRGILPAEPRAQPASYAAKSLEALEPTAGLTLGDMRLRQLLGQDCPVVPVWNEIASTNQDEAQEVVTAKSRGGKALNITQVTRPTLTVVHPPKEKQTGKAVIVCPGGGYGGLAAEHEGVAICRWLNEQGITGILLKYRVPRPSGELAKHAYALQDLQRAMRVVRAKADEYGVNPKQLGVCGFSAGGHLCAMLCANFAEDAYPATDSVDRQSARPDFAMLIYPAYLTEPSTSNDVDPLLKNLKRNQTPPMFMAAARDDFVTRGMLNFFLDVQAANVPAECHVYESGGHGGGLDPGSYPASQWTAAAARWLKDTLPVERAASTQKDQ